MYQDIKDTADRPESEVKDIPIDNLKLFVHFDTIYFGIVANNKLSESAAQQMLLEVKKEVAKMYKGNL